jgi:hypothetical protein
VQTGHLPDIVQGPLPDVYPAALMQVPQLLDALRKPYPVAGIQQGAAAAGTTTTWTPYCRRGVAVVGHIASGEEVPQLL